MSRKVLIAGAGQLGSRYLQGMAKYGQALEIWSYDVSADSLARAEQRWQEVEKARPDHRVHFVSTIEALPAVLDLTVVATTADVRPALVADIGQHSQVANWVLEKILAQSVAEIKVITTAIGPAARAWVNTPMHMWSLYRRLREQHPRAVPVVARFDGFRGLVCNAIHYIDLVARWNNARVVLVDTSGLQNSWYPAKRDGFYEVDGALALNFTDGSSLQLSSYRDNLGYRARLSIADRQWDVRESEGVARTPTGESVLGSIEFQTQLTAPLLESVFNQGDCALPTLAQSADQHTAFLSALLAHWNANMPAPRCALPIT